MNVLKPFNNKWFQENRLKEDYPTFAIQQLRFNDKWFQDNRLQEDYPTFDHLYI